MVLFLLTACLVNEDLYALRRIALRDGDGDGQSPEEGDCDDKDPLRYTGAPESCDGEDDNCNGAVDEEGTDGAYYFDTDGDGFGDPRSLTTLCVPPEGTWVQDAGDCNDGDSGVFPGADERCNGVDEDCDGSVDEDPVDPTTWHLDGDGDGFGDPDTTEQACEAPGGYVADDSDCDDDRTESHPGAGEQCDGLDNDCDGVADDPPIALGGGDWYPDADGDGFGDPAGEPRCDAAEGYVADATDCADTEEAIHPGAEEICSDGIDNDCDGGPGDCVWPGYMELNDNPSIQGDKRNDMIAETMAIGDVDGDATPELYLGGGLITSPTGVYAVGSVSRWNGPPSSTVQWSDAPTLAWGDNEYEFLGDGLAICDINGDGVDDLLTAMVGAEHEGNVTAGEIHVVYGPYTLASGAFRGQSDWTITGEETTSLLGWNLTCAPDMSGDGLPDILTASGSVEHVDVENTGAAYVITAKGTGTSAFADVMDAYLYATATDHNGMGYAITPADYSGDGLADYLVGCPGADGYAFLYHAPVTGTQTHEEADVTFLPSTYGAITGAQLISLGDHNGDGYEDIGISAQQEGYGAVYLVWGSATVGDYNLIDAPAKLRGDLRAGFGGALSNLGDINGDGEIDIGIGEFLSPSGDINLFWGPFTDGGTRYQSDADVWIEAADSDYEYPFLTNIGDWNGDAAPEIAIASTRHDVFDKREGAVFFLTGYGM